MSIRRFFIILMGFLGGIIYFEACANTELMPQNFVHLKDIDPTILQDMRYVTAHNFVGNAIPGYRAPTCILTRQAAQQLKKIQTAIRPLGYSLKVYDCYRPQQAVDAFVAWSLDASQTTKAEFYPKLNKKHLFKLGYIAEKSGHTRGSTMDVTMVQLPAATQARYQKNQPLIACYAPYAQRFSDNSIDMGTGFDCFSVLSHPENVDISVQAYLNRMFLRYWMEKYDFVPLETEWWHFTLKNEPYPDTYFNFPVR